MRFYIYGAGGHGKVVLDAIEVGGQSCHGFIDSNGFDQWVGKPVSSDKKLPIVSSCTIHIAIGHAATRAKLAQQLSELGYSFFTVRHPFAVISKNSKIGMGSFISATAVVAPYAVIGNHVIVNHGAVVDHDCVVGDLSHIAPRSVLGGGVIVENNVFVGSGAIVLPGICIGNNSVIGAGAIVTKNVAPGTTVVGNPAKPFIK